MLEVAVMRLVGSVTLALAVTTLGGVSHAQTPADRPPVPGAPAGVTAFVDVTVIPMDTERTLRHQTVLIREGRIAALGPAATLPVPPGAVRIDGRGRYLLPGFGACHGHISVVDGAMLNTIPVGKLPRLDPRYTELVLFQYFLAQGVTVLRNPDYVNADTNDFNSGIQRGIWTLTNQQRLGLRAAAAAGQLWSPRLVYLGAVGAGPVYRAELGPRPDPLPAPRMDSVAAYVAAFKAAGYDFIKLYKESQEMTDSVYAAARRVGLQVGGHIESGVSRMRWRGAPGGGSCRPSSATRSRFPRRRMGSRIPRRTRSSWRPTRARAAARGCGIATMRNGRQIRALGGFRPGRLTRRRRRARLVPARGLREGAGLTPYEALATGTKNYGQYLRTLDPHGAETGTIGVGQRADLVLLRGNPLTDIRYAAALDRFWSPQHS